MQGQVIDTFTWKADLAKAASATAYTSSGVKAYNDLPEGTPLYARLQMTGGGVKLNSTANPALAFYPLMLVVTETSPISGGQSFSRYYPFPGVSGSAFAVCYIPLRGSSKRTGMAATTFTFTVAASSTGEDAHSSANGNQGEVYAEICVGAPVERELYTIQHQLPLLQDYSEANRAISSFAFRRAHLGSIIMCNSANTASYRVRGLGHRAYNTTNIVETNFTITSNNVTSQSQIAPPAANVWLQPIHVDYYAAGIITDSTISMVGTIIGGPY